MTKITHILEDARGGGQLNYVLDIMQPDEYPYQLSLIASKGAESFLSKIEARKIPIKKLTLKIFQFNLLSILNYIFFFLPDVFTLVRSLKEMQTSLAINHGTIQIKGILACYILKIKCVWVIHDTQQPWYVLTLFKFISVFCKDYIFVSYRTKDYYEHIAPYLKTKNSTVLQSTVDTQLYKPEHMDILASYEGYKVVTVCYINKWKGLELLVDIAQYLESHYHKKINFFIVGPIISTRQKYHTTLEQRIKSKGVNNIHFLGFQPNPQDYINSADLYLCTSTYEASPIAIWESLACGQVTLSTDVGDVRDIFREHHCGYLLNDRDIKNASNVLTGLLTKDNNVLKQKARETAAKLFDPKERIKEHILFYEKILSN